MSSFDAVVIGAGPGGYVAAIRLAQLGQNVAVVEKEAIGGVCLNWGCIPSKALIYAAHLYEKMQHANKYGIYADNIRLNYAELVSWKDSVVGKLTGGVKQLLKANGVSIINGTAQFKSPFELLVTAPDQTNSVITAKQFIIATGSSVVDLPSLKIDHQVVIDSTDILALTEQPKTLVVVGGGIIGLELGMMLATLGTQVTVVELADQLLLGIDKDLVQVVLKRCKALGIKIHTQSSVESVTGNTVNIKTPTETLSTEAEKVLLCVGRKPNSASLALNKAGVETDTKGFITIDNQCRTSVKNIYAIGDVTATPYLAHKASKEGIIAAECIAGLDSALDYRAMPSAIFTSPEIATVGLSESQCKAQNKNYKTGKFPFAASGRALSMDEPDGFVKILADAETDELLGVQMVGPGVSELIAEAALAIEMGGTTEDIALTIHAHPTLPESLMEAAEALHHQAIHIFEQKR